MSNLDERIKKRLKRKKKFLLFRIISFILMINITAVSIFFVDYNMNKMLNRKSLIDNINLIEINIKKSLSKITDIEFY